MKPYLYIFSIILFFTGQSSAQVPGFQGKRFFIEVGGSFFPNLFYPTAQNKGNQTFPDGQRSGDFTMKDRYELSFFYVTGRGSIFKAAYNYQVSGLDSYAFTPSLVSGIDRHDLFYQLHMHDINLGFNLYRDKTTNLAPLGFFFDWGIRFVFVDGVLRDQKVDYADNRSDHTPYADQLAPLNINSFVFMFGLTGKWGYRTVIADRVTLTFGIESTFFPQFAGVYLSFFNTNSSNFQTAAILNAQDRYLLSLHIGVGALIY